MRIKLDENLPESLVGSLSKLGHDVDTVRMEGLAGTSDPNVWQAAQGAERFLITQDLDFSNIRDFAPGTHHGLLLLRLRMPGRTALARRLTAIFQSEDVASWQRCFVLATDWKIRVHRPKA
jgi:predicted nuclease of predicted toxin-antitoxin system